jgi:hypothetical protein
MTNNQDSLDNIVDKLKSTRDCDDGLVEILAYGRSAIPALRTLLFAREPSGLFEARCRAVDALAAVKAYDVLVDYLNAHQAAADPVECLGDDAVINYTAWAVARTREESVFTLLLKLAQRPALSGVIGALGAFGRIEAIPTLINALEEDGSRNVVEFMLLRLGPAGYEELLQSAQRLLPSQEHENESSRRRRRSSLSLLTKIGLRTDGWLQVRSLIADNDIKIAVLACKLWLSYAPPNKAAEAIDRLVALLPFADWLLREEIEGILPRAEFRAPQRPNRKVFH